jgi:hypothetical protein
MISTALVLAFSTRPTRDGDLEQAGDIRTWPFTTRRRIKQIVDLLL